MAVVNEKIVKIVANRKNFTEDKGNEITGAEITAVVYVDWAYDCVFDCTNVDFRQRTSREKEGVKNRLIGLATARRRLANLRTGCIKYEL